MLAVCGFLRCFFHLNHSPGFLDFHQPVNYRQSCSMECQPVASLYCILSPLQQRHPLRSSLQHIYSFLLHQIAAFSLPSLFTDQQCLGPFKTIVHIYHHYSMSNILETKTLEAYTSPFLVSISYIFLSLCNSLFFLPIDACRFINFFHNNRIVSLNLIFHLSFLCCFLCSYLRLQLG